MMWSKECYAHTDQIAAIAKVEKVFLTPDPIGLLTATYTGPQASDSQGLAIKCDLFDVNVPAVGIADLPRPDWNNFSVAYSLTSFNKSAGWVNEPYLYLSVVLHGPAGKSWQQTWATFHLDAAGSLTRRIKRFVTHSSPDYIQVIWEDWPIGSEQSAESIMEQALHK